MRFYISCMIIFILGIQFVQPASGNSINNDLQDIVKNSNEILVAVGNSGTILQSSDGKEWNQIKNSSNEDLNAIAVSGMKFVTVGNNGSILFSTDGMKWNPGKINMNIKFSDVVKDPTYRKTAVNTYKVNLNQTFIQKSITLKDIIWDGKKFVAPGHMIQSFGKNYQASSHIVATSTNGSSWSISLISKPDRKQYYPPGEISGIAYSGKRYVICTNSSLMYSDDLKTWKFQSRKKPSIRGDLNDISFNGKTFVAVGWDGEVGIYNKKQRTTGVIYTSTDGVNWAEVKINKDFGVTDIEWAKKTLDWNGFAFISIESIHWDGEYFLAGCEFGMILTSRDGTDWNLFSYGGGDSTKFNPMAYEKYKGLNADLNKVIKNGNDYIAIGNHGTILHTSDGTIWTVAH